MKSIAYYDGRTGSPDELMVPFNDRTHFFGDGVYDVSVGANGTLFLLDEHLDRFYSNARALDIAVPLGKPELATLLHELLSQVEGRFQFVYWQVSRGVAPRDHVYDEEMPGKLWAYIRPQSLASVGTPIAVITTEDRRFGYNHLKTLNLLPSVLYSQEAARAGVTETILHRDGIVTECAHSNVSILKDGIFRSHPNDEFILRGIAKTHMIQACHRLSIPVLEKSFTLEQLMDADEVIVTSSSKFCAPVREVDGVLVGGKDPETLDALQNAVLQEFFDATGVTDLRDKR